MGKKNKKKDFQKIKLKLGRQLKKDTNVTNTSFKTKKIIIKKQVKTALNQGLDDELVTNVTKIGQEGFKELLSKLSHYNASQRLETLIRIKEVLTSNPQRVISHLPGILENVCALMVDQDVMVRKSALYVLKYTLSKVQEQQISPFFPIIGSYVCCAMTHLLPEIREDSLIFLDVLLEKFPDLTVTSAGQILTNFLNQISVEKEKGVRTLTVSPNERITSQKWRLSVLRRMEAFLKAAFKNWYASNTSNDKPCREIVWDCVTPLYVTLYGTSDGLPQSLLGCSLASLQNQEKGNTVETLRDPESLQKLVTILIPLLVETWVECISYRRKALLTKEESDTMLCVLQVTALLGDWIETMDRNNTDYVNWLSDYFAKDFIVHFMPGFPYTNITPTIGESAKIPGLELNLTFCQVCTLMEVEEEEYLKINKFLESCFSSGLIKSASTIRKVIVILKRMIKIRSPLNYGESVIDKYIHPILECFWLLIQQWTHTRKERQLLVDFFLELALDHKTKQLLKFNAIDSWLETLGREVVNLAATSPELLYKFLKEARKMCPRGCAPFLRGLQEEVHNIIGLLNKFDCSDEVDNSQLIQRYLIELICAVPEIDWESFQALGRVCRTKSVSIKDLRFLLQILAIRCFDKRNPGFQATHFLSFLLSLQFGISVNDADSYQLQYNTNRDFSCFRINIPPISQFSLFPSDSEIWERHMQLTEEVSRIILQFPDMIAVEKASYDYLQRILSTVRFLPCHSVAGILNFVTAVQMTKRADSIEGLFEDMFTDLMDLTFAALSAANVLPIMPESVANKYRCDDFLDTILSFLQMTETIEMFCDQLPGKLTELEVLNEAAARCIGNVLLNLLKSEALQSYQLDMFKELLKSMQNMLGMKITDHSWWADVVYEIKMQKKEKNYRR